MAATTKRGMLKIAFIDSEGVCYHEAILGPKQAKELLVRSGIHEIRFGGHGYPTRYLSYAEAKRQPRAITGKPQGGFATICKEVIITPNE